jgi:hypothetical protein
VASDNSMCPGSTQPPKISTRILLGVKMANVTDSGSRELPEPSGPNRPVMGLLYSYIYIYMCVCVCLFVRACVCGPGSSVGTSYSSYGLDGPGIEYR